MRRALQSDTVIVKHIENRNKTEAFETLKTTSVVTQEHYFFERTAWTPGITNNQTKLRKKNEVK